MSQAGEHTWHLCVQYHRCPKCGCIIESRENFHYELGKWIKSLTCDRCAHNFIETKQRTPSFGPLIGDPQPREMEWS